jgi:hypothetical protein
MTTLQHPRTYPDRHFLLLRYILRTSQNVLAAESPFQNTQVYHLQVPPFSVLPVLLQVQAELAAEYWQVQKQAEQAAEYWQVQKQAEQAEAPQRRAEQGQPKAEAERVPQKTEQVRPKAGAEQQNQQAVLMLMPAGAPDNQVAQHPFQSIRLSASVSITATDDRQAS